MRLSSMNLSSRYGRGSAIGMLLLTAGVALAACGSTGDHPVSIPAATTIPTIATITTAAPPTNPVTTVSPPAAAPTGSVSPGDPTTIAPATTTTTVPCSLPGRSATSQTIPVTQVCSSAGAPHFDTPQAAMTYLAAAWNANNVQQTDYVTDPNGRAELDSMAAVMVNLRFERCTPNPGGDDTCYFMHDVFPSTSPTTYPNPMNYPPGEAVFTVAPAQTPGWYLTQVNHCG